MIVYADQLILLNGVVNYLLLLACAKLGSATICRPRILAASGIGAIYSLAAALPDLSFLPGVGMKAVVCVLMVLIAFGTETRIWRQGVLFLLLSFAYAGIVLAIATVLGADTAVRNGVVCYPVSFRVMVLTAGVTYALTGILLGRYFVHPPSELQQAELVCGDRRVSATALLDTGNELRDPLTNRNVIIMEWELARQLLPQKAAQLVDRKSASRPVELMRKLAAGFPELRMQLLPYHTLGAAGLLLALRCDRISLGNESVKSGWVALSPTELSKDGRYRALAGREL